MLDEETRMHQHYHKELQSEQKSHTLLQRHHKNAKTEIVSLKTHVDDFKKRNVKLKSIIEDIKKAEKSTEQLLQVSHLEINNLKLVNSKLTKDSEEYYFFPYFRLSKNITDLHRKVNEEKIKPRECKK